MSNTTIESPANNLLASELKRPLDRAALGDDTAALNALVGFLNSPVMESTAQGDGSTGELATGAPPISEISQLEKAQSAASRAKPPRVAAAPTAPTAPPPSPVSINLARVFYTGRLCSGKDYVAGLTGATVEGFARPLYHLAEFFFGVPVNAGINKDVPGMRAFLQTAGQWGRGVVNEQYPYTPARAVFIAAIRSLAGAKLLDESLGVKWEDYGRDENLWLNAALARINVASPARVAITNVRYANEFKALTESGYTNWHVMTTPKEWEARLASRKIALNSPVLKDTSEQLAAHLDAQVIRTISQQKVGPKLRVIWNSTTPPPSSRLWTVQQFLDSANISAAPIIDNE